MPPRGVQLRTRPTRDAKSDAARCLFTFIDGQRNALSGTRWASRRPRHWSEPRRYARASAPSKLLLQRELRRPCHFWLELRPPGHHFASKPRVRSAPDVFGQMRAQRCDDRRCAMCVASAIGPLAIEIVGIVGDIRHPCRLHRRGPGSKPRRGYDPFGRWSRCQEFAFGPNCDVARIGTTLETVAKESLQIDCGGLRVRIPELHEEVRAISGGFPGSEIIQHYKPQWDRIPTAKCPIRFMQSLRTTTPRWSKPLSR
jgi:hypothetical protein